MPRDHHISLLGTMTMTMEREENSIIIQITTGPFSQKVNHNEIYMISICQGQIATVRMTERAQISGNKKSVR